MGSFIKHESNASGVFWHIDKVEKNNGGYTILGWISHNQKKIKSVLVGNRTVTADLISRPDVLTVYRNFPTDLVGIFFSIENNEIYNSVRLVFEDGSQSEDVGTLFKWVTYHSGFKRTDKDIIVVNDFYDDPDMVRKFAIENIPFQESNYHRGKRSADRFILDGTKEKFESIIGKPIVNWNYEYYANGMFQYCTSTDPIVYHVDSQNYAAMVYLTPNAPVESGTSFFKSKVTGATAFPNIEDRQEEYHATFRGLSKDLNFYDKTQFELIDTVGNVYNRLVLFNAKAIHAAAEYFGDSIENARFFHLFFFDVE